ncbi:MAG: cytochrome c family protein [Caulobacterales bacterium]|nr:cytochrome c family protein [Caulobacterales bacterium]
MSELFWNKIIGSALTTLMVIFGLNELAHVVYHPHALEEPAYVIEVPDEAGGSAEPVEEGPPDFGALIPVADVAAGENQAKKCVACHTFNAGGNNLVGPNLWNVMGRVAGGVDGFNYSGAMTDYAQPWDYQNLYDYLERPAGYISGTAMAFAGLRKSEDRINIIAYIRQQADTPLALPAPLPAPEEAAASEDASPAAEDGADGE